MSGRRIGRYVLRDAFASGGMATVHFGQLVAPGRDARVVAIKRVADRLAHDAELAAALVEEGKITARVRHPNALTALDVVADGRDVILVMEYVHGASLAELLRAARARGEEAPLDVLSAIVAGALRGLDAAHAAQDDAGRPLGLVHRDVSPQNVLVGVDGVARIVDFGIAKSAAREPRTRTGHIKGKLTYLSPEQVHGGATSRSDVFAMGVTAWEAIVGKPLFTADSDSEVLARVLAGPIARPSAERADVPPALDAVVLRALEREPELRFATAGEMAAALEAAVPPAHAARVGAWVARLAEEPLAARAATIARLARAPMASASRRLAVRAAVAAALVALAVGSLFVGLRARAHARASAAGDAADASAPVARAPDDTRAASTELAPAAPPTSTSAPPAPAPAATHRRAAPRERPDCNPPFVIDANRRKHFKPECF